MSFQNEIRETPTDSHPIAVALVGILSLLPLTVSNDALAASESGMDCGTWTVDIKSGTYNTGDEIWSKGAAQFTHRHGTCPSGNETMGSQTCNVLDGGTCTIQLTGTGANRACASGSSKVEICTSPTLKLDTTPPSCGNWKYDGNNTWIPGVSDASALDWMAAKSPSFRDVRVSISDNQSWVSETWWPVLYPQSMYDLTNADSNTTVQMALAGFAQVEVTDNAGNSTSCVGPRKRMDGFAPPMATLTCDNFISDVRPLTYPYQGAVRCGLSDRWGPSLRKILLRQQTYNANASGNISGGPVTDTNWTDRGDMRLLMDVDGNPIRSGTAYDAESAPLRYEFTPTMEKITVLTMRICEFYGTSDQRCTDSNEFIIKKLSPPPPIPETIGDGWYECQNASIGSMTWYSPNEGVPGTNQTLVFSCSPDGTGSGEPRSRAKISGTVAPAGTTGCWCWDNQPPTIGSLTASPATWTNQSVTINGIASNLTLGWSPYGGIQYSCDNGSTWSAGTTASTATFSCATPSGAGLVAKVRSCDMASNCSTAQSVQYFIDVTAPVASSAGYFQITGKTHDSIGHTADTGAGNNSTQYTFTKNVTIRLDPSDTLPGSGLAAIRFSCDPTAPSASASGWESWAAGAGTKTFDLTDSAYGCNGSEGVKTVYAWAKDAAGNVSSAVSASITYDKTSPDFEVYSTPILLRAVPNYVYQIQNPTDAAGSAGFKDFSLTWIPESGPQTSYPDIPGNAPPFSKSFDPLARFVNEGCDANNDGKCVATIRITLEDRTGNIKTREQRLEIIPNTIATVTGDVSLTSNKTDAGTVADLDDRYTYSIHLRDANGNIIRPVPGILEIRGDWAFENNASFLGNEINPSNGDMRDGSIWYNWDDGNWTSSSNGNSASRVYVWASTKTDGNYTIQVRSSVPTREGYAGLTRNNIKLKTLLFTNALASSSSSGCPSGYVCDGTNANGSYDRSLGSNLANDGTVNRYLTFKPAMEVIPSKTWNDLTDGTWHELKLTFKNNSTNHSFSPSKYGFDFRYETYLGNFADLSIKGDLGTHTGLGEGTLNKISFFMTSGLPVVEKSSSVDKVISLRANSHGIGFGKIGFSGFLPYILENNAICNGTNCSSPLATTGYNTQNIGLNSGIMSFDYQSSPIPSNEFGNSQSYAQKFAASGQIANSAKNRIQAIESGVAIETGTMDKTQFKTNVNKNVEAITRSIASDNGTNCSVTLTSVEKELYYYDFTKLTGAAINGNKGCVLTLRWPSTGASSGYRKLGVTGKKTIIVRGGNVLIDTDMYYGDSNSMLALVVLRNENDRTKGGNIYVDPKVTNIVGAGYAEGSLISYDASVGKIFDIGNTVEGDLTRQLLWYGSLFSANTVGWSMNSTSSWECPFGSDTYEATKSKSCSEDEASRYDFALVRRFALINATAPAACVSAGKKAPKSTGTSAEPYATAGKKKCFLTDANDIAELRSTAKTASFVMEYNSFMMNAGMKVFSK